MIEQQSKVRFDHTVKARELVAVSVRVVEDKAGNVTETFMFKTSSLERPIGRFDEAEALVEALTEAIGVFKRYREDVLGEKNDLSLTRIMKRRV